MSGARITETIFFAFILICVLSGIQGCYYYNEEELFFEWQLQDSLENKIPTLKIVAPNLQDTVVAPFTVLFEATNWALSKPGQSIIYSLDDRIRGVSYQNKSLVVPLADSGWTKLKLILVRRDGTFTPVQDSVNLFVQSPPDNTFRLTVIGGAGSGNYTPDEAILIEAIPPGDGFQFAFWKGDTSQVIDPFAANTEFIMGTESAFIEANFEKIPISYAEMIHPIFVENCESCHNGAYPPLLLNCEQINSALAVVASRIQDTNDPMPPSGLMPLETINIIKEWISQGAPCEN